MSEVPLYGRGAPKKHSFCVQRGARLERHGTNVFKAHRLLYHSTLGLRVIKKKHGTNVHDLDDE